MDSVDADLFDLLAKVRGAIREFLIRRFENGARRKLAIDRHGDRDGEDCG